MDSLTFLLENDGDQLLLVRLSVSLPSSYWSPVTLLASDWSVQIT